MSDNSELHQRLSHAAAQRRYNKRKLESGWRRVCFWVPKGRAEAELKTLAKDFLQQFYKD